MSLWASPILRSCIKHRSVRDLEERTHGATVVSTRTSLLRLIVGKEFSLPGGDPFAVELGEFSLPFFDQREGLPPAPLGLGDNRSLIKLRSVAQMYRSEVETAGDLEYACAAACHCSELAKVTWFGNVGVIVVVTVIEVVEVRVIESVESIGAEL